MKVKRRVVRKAMEAGFVGLFLAGIVVALAVLAILLGAVVTTAWPHLRPSLVTNYAEYRLAYSS